MELTIPRIIKCVLQGLTLEETLLKYDVHPGIKYEQRNKRFNIDKKIRRYYPVIILILKSQDDELPVLNHLSGYNVAYEISRKSKLSTTEIKGIIKKVEEAQAEIMIKEVSR